MSLAGRVFRKSLDMAAHFALATMNPDRSNVQAAAYLTKVTGLPCTVSLRKPCDIENPRIAFILSFNEKAKIVPYVLQWAINEHFGEDNSRFTLAVNRAARFISIKRIFRAFRWKRLQAI